MVDLFLTWTKGNVWINTLPYLQRNGGALNIDSWYSNKHF
jgi:hypothetical protein